MSSEEDQTTNNNLLLKLLGANSEEPVSISDDDDDNESDGYTTVDTEGLTKRERAIRDGEKKYEDLSYLIYRLPSIHALHKLGGQENLDATHWLRPRYEFETLTRDNKVTFHNQLHKDIKDYIRDSGNTSPSLNPYQFLFAERRKARYQSPKMKKETVEEAAAKLQGQTSKSTAKPKQKNATYKLSGPVITRGEHELRQYVPADSNVLPTTPLLSKDKNYDYLPLYEDFRDIDPNDESTHPPINVLLTDYTAAKVIDRIPEKRVNWPGDFTKSGDLKASRYCRGRATKFLVNEEWFYQSWRSWYHLHGDEGYGVIPERADHYRVNTDTWAFIHRAVFQNNDIPVFTDDRVVDVDDGEQDDQDDQHGQEDAQTDIRRSERLAQKKDKAVAASSKPTASSKLTTSSKPAVSSTPTSASAKDSTNPALGTRTIRSPIELIMKTELLDMKTKLSGMKAELDAVQMELGDHQVWTNRVLSTIYATFGEITVTNQIKPLIFFVHKLLSKMPMPATETSEFNDLSFTNVIYPTPKAKARQATLTPKTDEPKFILPKVICKPAEKHD